MRFGLAPLLLFSLAAFLLAEPAAADELRAPEPTSGLVTGGPNPLLLGSGAATFVFGWAPALWVGATSGHGYDRLLFIPFAGPFLSLARRESCACASDAVYDGLLVTDGIVQAAGAALAVIALADRDLREEERPAMRARLRFGPFAVSGVF